MGIAVGDTAGGNTQAAGAMARVKLGALVRALREDRGWTQEDLEARSDVSQGYLSQIETGSRRWLTLRMIEQLAAAFDVQPSLLKYAMVYDGEEAELDDGITIVVIGRVPQRGVRWRDATGLEISDVRILAEDVAGARSPVGLVIERDDLRSFDLRPGDVVIVDLWDGGTPNDGQKLVLRIGDSITVARWYQVADAIELRDGAGNVAHRIALTDDYDVIGAYLTFRPLAPR